MLATLAMLVSLAGCGEDIISSNGRQQNIVAEILNNNRGKDIVEEAAKEAIVLIVPGFTSKGKNLYSFVENYARTLNIKSHLLEKTQANITIPEYADSIYNFTSQWLRGKQIFLIGESCGALSCIQFAIDHPENIGGIMAIQPPLGGFHLINLIPEVSGFI